LAGNIASLPPDSKPPSRAQRAQIAAASGEAGIETQDIRAIERQLADGGVLVIGRRVDETMGIGPCHRSSASPLGLVAAFGLCLVAGRARQIYGPEKRIEEINERVERIVGGDLSERLPRRKDEDPPLKPRGDRQWHAPMRWKASFHALAGVGNDIAP